MWLASSPEIAATLADAACGMIAGQAADVSNEGACPDANVLTFIHEQKTGRLFEAACRMGGLSADADAERLARLSTYGRWLGVAFQITDDVLDATAASESLGKRSGKDARSKKMTYPAVYGVAESRARANSAVEKAVGALEPFGPAADDLRAWARHVAERA